MSEKVKYVMSELHQLGKRVSQLGLENARFSEIFLEESSPQVLTLMYSSRSQLPGKKEVKPSLHLAVESGCAISRDPEEIEVMGAVIKDTPYLTSSPKSLLPEISDLGGR